MATLPLVLQVLDDVSQRLEAGDLDAHERIVRHRVHATKGRLAARLQLEQHARRQAVTTRTTHATGTRIAGRAASVQRITHFHFYTHIIATEINKLYRYTF